MTRGLLVRSTVPVTVSIGVSAPCAVGYLIGGKCVAKWVGSSSTTLPGGIPIEGKLVTWVPDGHSHPSGVLGYVAATGTIKVESWTDGVGCFHTYLDDSYTLSGTNDPNGTGTLLVNTNVVPPTYRGSVVTQWFGQTTSSCPDGSSGTADTIIGGAWFSGSGSLNANDASFGATDFTDPTLLQSFTYGFSSR